MASISQQDFNKESGQSLRKVLRQLEVVFYEVAKAIIQFTQAMVTMFLGK